MERHRLSITHPDYRYPSSANPYWHKLHDVHGLAYADNDTETARGLTLSRFADAAEAPKDRKLHVEIGCNAGHVLVEWAARNPSDAFIGIDWKHKQIYRAVEKILKRRKTDPKALQNAMFYRAHAGRLPYMFGEGEIDRLYLFFPDPWPKKAQRKHRFIQPEMLRAIHPLLKKDGIFHIKTDHPGYFEWMEECVEATKDLWTVTEHTRDLHAGNPKATELKIPDVTLFERLFIKDGIKIHSMKLGGRPLSV